MACARVRTWADRQGRWLGPVVWCLACALLGADLPSCPAWASDFARQSDAPPPPPGFWPWLACAWAAVNLGGVLGPRAPVRRPLLRTARPTISPTAAPRPPNFCHVPDEVAVCADGLGLVRGLRTSHGRWAGPTCGWGMAGSGLGRLARWSWCCNTSSPCTVHYVSAGVVTACHGWARDSRLGVRLAWASVPQAGGAVGGLRLSSMFWNPLGLALRRCLSRIVKECEGLER